jgi:hypothetical protein
LRELPTSGSEKIWQIPAIHPIPLRIDKGNVDKFFFQCFLLRLWQKSDEEIVLAIFPDRDNVCSRCRSNIPA